MLISLINIININNITFITVQKKNNNKSIINKSYFIADNESLIM